MAHPEKRYRSRSADGAGQWEECESLPTCGRCSGVGLGLVLDLVGDLLPSGQFRGVLLIECDDARRKPEHRAQVETALFVCGQGVKDKSDLGIAGDLLFQACYREQ